MASEHDAKSAAERTSAAEPRGAVDRTTELSEDLVQAPEDSSRAALDAVTGFAVTLEKALPEEVKATSEVANQITDGALEMAQQLIHTQAQFLRTAVDSAGKSLSRSADAK